MSILKNQLQSSILGLKGNTPNKRAGALNTSKLHNINSLGSSNLDLDGNTPEKYLDNIPS